MALSQTVRQELQEELTSVRRRVESLRSEVAVLEETAAALERILGGGVAEKGVKGAGAPKGGFGRRSLGEAVSGVLAERGALKPRQVTRALASRGYKDDKKTDLGLRVSGLLWRGAKDGKYSRNDRGEYSLPSSEAVSQSQRSDAEAP